MRRGKEKQTWRDIRQVLILNNGDVVGRGVSKCQTGGGCEYYMLLILIGSLDVVNTNTFCLLSPFVFWLYISSPIENGKSDLSGEGVQLSDCSRSASEAPSLVTFSLPVCPSALLELLLSES